MPSPAKRYDLKLVQLILGGYPIEGFGESDAVSIEPVSGVTESSVGADGQVTYSSTNDNRAKVTITVRENSVAHKHLHTLLEAQRAAPILAALPFLLLDPISGERISSQQFVFTGRPTVTKSKTVSDRVYTGELPYGFATGNVDAAPLIAL